MYIYSTTAKAPSVLGGTSPPWNGSTPRVTATDPRLKVARSACHSLLLKQIQRVLDQPRIQAFTVSGNHHIDRELLQPAYGNRPLLDVRLGGVSRRIAGEDHATSEKQFPGRKIHGHLIGSLRGTGVEHSDVFPPKR